TARRQEGVGPGSHHWGNAVHAGDRDRHQSLARDGDRPLRCLVLAQTRAVMSAPGRRPSRRPRPKGSVALVAMPWHVLHLPSIQLGTLRPLLEDAGIRTEVRSYTLEFMEHCRAATHGAPEERGIGPAAYGARTAAAQQGRRGAGDRP